MRTKKSKLIIGIVFLGICFTVFIIRISITESRFDNLHSRFQPISMTDALNDYVIKKHKFKGFKYTPTMVFVTLNSNKDCKIYSALNPLYSNKGINDILEEGDKLKKNTGSDTIFIYKKDTSIIKKYYFLLKQFNK
ncbi:MAG: hypothetical protein ACERIH_04645 [Labilibaculum antarcticum]